MKKNRKLGIVAVFLAMIMLIVPFFSLNVFAEEDTSSKEETSSTAAEVKGVKINSIKAYGTNSKYYPDSDNSIKSVKGTYSAKVTVPRWMTNCTLYISADKSAKVTYDGKEFEYTKSGPYDGKAYFYYDFKFDKAEKKDASHEYEITITQGDAKSSLLFTVRQTVIKAKLESISVAGEKATGSVDEGFTYTLPSGTKSAKIKIVPRSEEKVNFAKHGEELAAVELNKNYQNYQFKQSLEEGENVFDIQVIADTTTIDSTLTIYVGEAPVSSVPEAVVTPTDGGSTVMLINGKEKTSFGKDMRGNNYMSYINLAKGANEFSILYNSADEKSVVLTLVPTGDVGDYSPIVDVNGNPVDVTLTENGYEGTVSLVVGAPNTISVKTSSADAAQMAIYVGKGLNVVEESEPPVESLEPDESSKPVEEKSEGISPLLWVIIGIIAFVVIGAIIYIASTAGKKNNYDRERYDYDERDDYYRGGRAQRPSRDIGSYIDDDYGYDDYGNDQSYRDDGYYDQEPPYYDDNAPRGGSGERFYEEDDYYDERPSRRRPAGGGQPVRRDNRYRPSQRNNYDDYYDDDNEY